jgi:hypothetical protein
MKRDINILLAYRREINLTTKVKKSKKAYNRASFKKETKGVKK